MSSQQTMLISPSRGRCLFDAVFTAEHSLNLMVTRHPVQSGASVADHAFMEPHEVVLSVGISDAMTGIDTIAGTSLPNRSVNAFQALCEMMEARERLTLVTRLRTYTNMMITAISNVEDHRSMLAIKPSITLQEVQVVHASIIPIQQTCASSKITYETGEEATGGTSAVPAMNISNSAPVSSMGGVTTTNTSVAQTYTGSSKSGASSTSPVSSNQSVLKQLATKLFG